MPAFPLGAGRRGKQKGSTFTLIARSFLRGGADRVIVILLPPAHFSSLSFGRVTAALRGVLQPGEVRAAHSSRSTVALR